jgi:hypothetical protein
MPISFHLRLLCIQFTCAFLLSGVITFINKGYDDRFYVNWSQGFIGAFILISFVVKLIPLLGAFLGKYIGPYLPRVIFKCLMAFCVAIMMETVIAFAITSIQFGWHEGFPGQWFNAAVMALPVGIMIGLTMVFFIQPKIQALIEEGKRIQALKNARE